MKTIALVCSIPLLALACSSTPPPATPAGDAAPSAASATAAKPDGAKAQAHLKEHVKYPASRADILAACADTPEFTAAEKQWLAQNLPEGKYGSAGEVIEALHL